MKLTLEINEATWQYELDKFNATESARVTQGNEAARKQYDAVMSHTPEKLRTIFTPAPDFAQLTLEQFVQKFVSEREAQSAAAITADHDRAILAATPEDKARMAKILEQSDATKDAIRAQVDSLPF